MNEKVVALFVFIGYLMFSQQCIGQVQNEILGVYPKANQLNISLESEIVVTIHTPISLLRYNESDLFNVQGANSGIISGKISIDTHYNQFIFKPDKNFYPGEIINVGFGQLFDGIYDTAKAMHWQFTTVVPLNHEAKFSNIKKIPIATNGSGFLLDINKDGYLDILRKDGYVFYGGANYTFQNKGYIDSDGVQINEIRLITDINSDGKLDMIAFIENYKSSVVFIGGDDMKFSLRQKISVSDIKAGAVMAVADINADNKNDLICIYPNVSDTTYDINCLLNDGNGNFLKSKLLTKIKGPINDLTVADMDRDGRGDLVVSFYPTSIFNWLALQIYKNSFDGKLLLKKEIFYGYHTTRPGILLQDYDDNGILDVSIERNVGTSFLFEDDTTFNIKRVNTWGALDGPGISNHGDFDGDGKYDIVTTGIIYAIEDPASPIGMVINFGGTTSYSTVVSTLNNYSPSGRPLIGDIDNDGDMDVINCGNPTYIAINSFTTGIKNTIQAGKNLLPLCNYPNPFNPETTISYSIPKSEHVTLKVFDVLGREAATLVDEYKNAGNYKVTFNVKTLRVTPLPSGIYFYRLTTPATTITKKMLLVK